MRNFNAGMVALRKGEWRGGDEAQVKGGEKEIKMPSLGRDPRGKVLGILGMGGIGKTLARKVWGAFGMRVKYLNRRRDGEGERELREGEGVEVEWVGGGGEGGEGEGGEGGEGESGKEGGFEEGLKRLLKESDVLSLNLPLNVSTIPLEVKNLWAMKGWRKGNERKGGINEGRKGS